MNGGCVSRWTAHISGAEVMLIIPQPEVYNRAATLLDILVKGGLGPAGFDRHDLVPIAMKVAVTDIVYEAVRLGVEIAEPVWEAREDGAIEIKVPCVGESEAVLLRIAAL